MSKKPKSIVLICVDALRADESDDLKQYFTHIFPNYRSTQTWTLAAHAAMLGSVYAPELKKSVDHKKMVDTYENYFNNLPTIASSVRQFGYKAHAYTGGGFLSTYFGWGHDWDSWTEPDEKNKEWIGQKIKIKAGGFYFLHTFYVHDWFKENQALHDYFWQWIKSQNDSGRLEISEFDQHMMEVGYESYKKRIYDFCKRLSWIQSLDDDVLVILTADHSEIFHHMHSFHHGKYALSDRDIYKVPLFIRQGKLTKINTDICIHDLDLQTMILSLIRNDHTYFSCTQSSEQVASLLTSTQSQSEYQSNKYYQDKINKLHALISDQRNELDKLRNSNHQLSTSLTEIYSAKAFKIWQFYCRVLGQIGLKQR